MHYCTPPVSTYILRLSSSSRLAARAKTQRKRCLQKLRIDTHPCSMKKGNGIGFRQPYERDARSQLSHAAYPSPCDEARPSLPQVKPVAHSFPRASNLSIRFAHSSAAAHAIFFDMRRIFRSLCPQSFVAHVLVLTCVDLSIALPAVACNTCLYFEPHASNFPVRIACKSQYM